MVINRLFAGFREQTFIQGGIIVCALRSKDSKHCLQMAEIAGKYRQISPNEPPGVLGFDIAGDEGNFPLNSLNSEMCQGLLKAKGSF